MFGCSLIGTRTQEFATQRMEDSLKKGKSQVAKGSRKFCKRLLGGVCRAHCIERRKRQACRWKAEAQFGGPSRNSDERSSL